MKHTNNMMRTINYIVSDIKNQNFNVDKIIFFGSAVKNELSPDSDLDVCIVLKDEDKNTQEISAIRNYSEIQTYLADLAADLFEIDYVICTNEKLQSGEHIFDSIRKEGVLVWKTPIGR